MKKIVVFIAALLSASFSFSAEVVKQQGITTYGNPRCALISTTTWTTFWNPVLTTSSLTNRYEMTITEVSTAAANMILVWGSTTTPTFASTMQSHLFKPGISQSLGVGPYVVPWMLSLNAGVAGETACMQESGQ